MRANTIIGAICLVVWLTVLPAGAEAGDPGTLVGKWTYSTSDHWSKGVCPSGRNMQGMAEISRVGNTVRLVLKTGAVCRPPVMCIYEVKASAKGFIASNSAAVDNEGGKVTNTIRFEMKDGNAYGISTSTYLHPGGMRCDWGYKVKFQRSK